jgi:hypothetical protein
MRELRNLFAGAALGALILGLGGRMVMRLLALTIDRDPSFSLGGTAEIVAYGSIVGFMSAALLAIARPILPRRWPIRGLILAALGYAGTIATLPAHIADTARPFADRMPLVMALFGLCFLLFGLALARLNSLWSSPAPAAAPAVPPE